MLVIHKLLSAWMNANFPSYFFFLGYRNSAGFVYLRFETVEGAAAAQRAMHLRWFAGRQISALFMVALSLSLTEVVVPCLKYYLEWY